MPSTHTHTHSHRQSAPGSSTKHTVLCKNCAFHFFCNWQTVRVSRQSYNDHHPKVKTQKLCNCSLHCTDQIVCLLNLRHSSMSLQFFPSPVNPGKQLQLWDPNELKQVALLLHSCTPVVHSLMSLQNTPLPLNPNWHMHIYAPGKFWHWA